MHKYTQASWPGMENLDEYITEDSEGNLTLRSTDEEGIASITLSANGFQVMCSFLYLLPFKKPKWIDVADLQASFMSATGSVMSQPGSARRMKMAYEYA